MECFSFLVLLLLAASGMTTAAAKNADDKALIPFSKLRSLEGGSNNKDDVVIQLQNQGGGNMKLKLGHGVLVPVESLKHFASPKPNTKTSISNRSDEGIKQSNVEPTSDSSKSVNASVGKTDQSLWRNTTQLKEDSLNASLTSNEQRFENLANQETLSTNTTTNNVDNDNDRDNITLSGKDATSFFNSISQAGIKHEGTGDTVVRIDINREDFENIRKRPKFMKEFKSILKKAIDGKHGGHVKLSPNRKSDNFRSNTKSPNKLVERQKLILAKKTAALSKMAKLASKNLDEIKRLEQEALHQQMLLNEHQGESQLDSNAIGKKKTPMKIFENPSNAAVENTSEINEVFVKPHLTSAHVSSLRNITQSSLGTGARKILEPPKGSFQNDVTEGRNQSAAPLDIVPKTTTTTTTTTPPPPPPTPPPPPPAPPSPTRTTTTGIVPLTTISPKTTTPIVKQQMMTNNLSPIQSNILEKNLNVLSDQENALNSSSSSITTNSSSPFASQIQSSTASEPFKDEMVHVSSSASSAKDMSSPKASNSSKSLQSSFSSSKDEMLVGDSQPVGTEQYLKTDSFVGFTSGDQGTEDSNQHQNNDEKTVLVDKKAAKKKKKIKILILNGDEEIPEKLKSDQSVHMIDTDTELGQQTAFKKELCNGIGYIKCLERSTFEEQNHSGQLSSTRPLAAEQLHEDSSYKPFDSEYREFSSNLDDGANKENYDPATNIVEDSMDRFSTSNEDVESEAQNMEFAIQSAAADAARSNRLRSFAHEQAFLNGPVARGIERRRGEDVEDLYYKRNRNLKWKRKMKNTKGAMAKKRGT